MREFFKPWRRKVGVLTLVVACVFAAGWVRSIYSHDTLEFRFQRLNCSMYSSSSPGRVFVGVATGKLPQGNFTFHTESVREIERAEREQKQEDEEHKKRLEEMRREEMQEQHEETQPVVPDSESDSEPEHDRGYLFGLVDTGEYGGGSGDFPMTVNYHGRYLKSHYAIIFIPLTLLSAYLLLTKPKRRPEVAS